MSRRINLRFPFRIRFLRLTMAALLIFGIFVSLYFVLQFDLQQRRPLRVKYITLNLENKSLACRLPSLDPFHPSIFKFIQDLGKLRCNGSHYSTLRNNVLEVEGENVTSVEYRTIDRAFGNDSKVRLSNAVRVPNRARNSSSEPEEKRQHEGKFYGHAKVEADFIRVDVVTTSNKTKSEVHMNVFPKKEVVGRTLQPGGIPLDVALIMFDSTSAANFKRKLPNSFEYLTKNLDSVLLRGETIVGDGTTAQLSAMLTGIAEEEQPEARRDQGAAGKPVDEWRWIFKDYKHKGYVTMFSEDSPHHASFNYRLNGFRDPPTDHYARPFWLEADPIVDGYCINSRASHEISLSYLLNYFRVYKFRPKFSFISHCEISHNDPNAVGYVDDDLKNFLQAMEKETFLNSTFLVIFGDHGARFSDLRKTIQGKLEERLPFLSITTPKWFPKTYPDLYSNLVHNSQVLTTPFDVYTTLRHIVSYPEYPSGITTGQSLFNRIEGENRTCVNAGVEDHWCPCLNLEEVSITEPVIREAAEFVVNHINKLTSRNAELLKLCHTLVLKEIKSAFRDMPSEAMQMFEQSKRDSRCDSCGLVLGAKAENTLRDTLYQLQLVTSPNEGFYEATLRLKHGVLTLVGDMSRLDAYKGQEHCVQDYPHLRKYCYCVNPFTAKDIAKSNSTT